MAPACGAPGLALPLAASPTDACPLLTGMAVMLQPGQPKDAGEMRVLGKGGRGWSNKGCLWGKKRKKKRARHHSRWGSSVSPHPSFAISPRAQA